MKSADPAIPPCILVVDNDPLIRLGTVFMLRENGLNAESADSARHAHGLIEGGFVPDLLITDYAMPGGNGVALAYEIAGLNPDLRVLIVTGQSSIDEPLRDAWRVLTKPFTSAELYDAIVDMNAIAS